jgi:hypothetical protein
MFMNLKTYLYLIISLVIVTESCVLGQAALVADVVLQGQIGSLITASAEENATQTTMSSVMQAIENAEKEYKEAMKKTGWMQNMKSTKRLLHTIQNLICSSRTISLKMEISGGSCLYSFKYEMVLVKLQLAADYIQIILSGVSMTVGERAKTLDDATRQFEESQKVMDELDKNLDDEAAHVALVKEVSSEVEGLMNYDRSKRQ